MAANRDAARGLGSEDERLQREIWERQCPALLAERDELRRVLYEAIREVPTSQASVHQHRDLQRLHRRVIAALREEDPGEFVLSDYWLGRTP